jgi:hypothetical protein
VAIAALVLRNNLNTIEIKRMFVLAELRDKG